HVAIVVPKLEVQGFGRCRQRVARDLPEVRIAARYGSQPCIFELPGFPGAEQIRAVSREQAFGGALHMTEVEQDKCVEYNSADALPARTDILAPCLDGRQPGDRRQDTPSVDVRPIHRVPHGRAAAAAKTRLLRSPSTDNGPAPLNTSVARHAK